MDRPLSFVAFDVFVKYTYIVPDTSARTLTTYVPTCPEIEAPFVFNINVHNVLMFRDKVVPGSIPGRKLQSVYLSIRDMNPG